MTCWSSSDTWSTSPSTSRYRGRSVERDGLVVIDVLAPPDGLVHAHAGRDAIRHDGRALVLLALLQEGRDELEEGVTCGPERRDDAPALDGEIVGIVGEVGEILDEVFAPGLRLVRGGRERRPSSRTGR